MKANSGTGSTGWEADRCDADEGDAADADGDDDEDDGIATGTQI